MNKSYTFIATLFLLCMLPLLAWAEGSLKLIPVNARVWAIVGPLENRTAENLGNNATFGFVVTEEGIVLIDSGGTEKGAAEIHRLIQSVTTLPIRYVINTGGQDHRWFGNHYFSQLGAKIISSMAAKQDQQSRLNQEWTVLETLIGKSAISGTQEKYADISFEEHYTFTLGGISFEIHHPGQAHTAGDAYVWLPQLNTVFSGDIVFTERLLGILDVSNSKSWLAAFEAMAEHKPSVLIPGHGSPTSLSVATEQTYNYLMYVRTSVSRFMEDGGGAADVSSIDQTPFKGLYNYDTLKGRNALKVYTELEWE